VGNASSPAFMTVVGNKLMFRAYTTNWGHELYEYNGVDTPKLVADILPDSPSSAPSDLVDFDGKLRFVAQDLVSGRELRMYDGTNAPTLVYDNTPGSESSRPSYYIEYNDTMYFTVDDGIHGAEMWKYNGTGSPTLAYDYLVGINQSHNPEQMIEFEGKIYYRGQWQNNRHEMFEFDGDTTIQVTAIIANGNGSYPQEFYVFDDKLLFTAREADGQEMYAWDGDTAVQVADINPSGDANPFSYTEYKGKLYFSANDGTNSTELMEWDGTNAPTLLADLNSTGDGYPTYFSEYKGI
jgi:ELWxxDGT repeat protein